MVHRLIKYAAIGLISLVALTVALVATNYYFPSTYEASAQLPGSESVVVVQLQPMHLYLAEYRRALVLRKPGSSDQRQDMFPDTGGYSRTQLYQLADGRFLVEGTFDSYIVDAAAHSISTAPKKASSNAKYLGVFDDTGDGRWRYLSEAESPRKQIGAN